MDTLSQGIRDATSEDEIERKSHRVEEIIHRDAPWIPGYAIPYIRCGYWRWVRWPDNFNIKQIRDVHASYVFWIDDEIKEETKKAMREGTTFPEKNLIFDQHLN
jgi:microcin C transport system substrate-binding protein